MRSSRKTNTSNRTCVTSYNKPKLVHVAPMTLSPLEDAQKNQFEAFYTRAQTPVMRSIERYVCGCDYGGNSWTTRTQAEQIITLLGLKPGVRLLDLGAGSGWPSLYMVEVSACDAVLIDLQLVGLRIIAKRSHAITNRLAGACWVAAADAAELPFQNSSFDAISHCDVLCCLQQKCAVLDACYQAIRPSGRMVFTVITLAPHLSQTNRRWAIENGPEFIASDDEYPALLEQVGWTILDHQDLTPEYIVSCQRQLQADLEQKDALTMLIGTTEYTERQTRWQSRLMALNDGLLRRELFIATR